MIKKLIPIFLIGLLTALVFIQTISIQFIIIASLCAYLVYRSTQSFFKGLTLNIVLLLYIPLGMLRLNSQNLNQERSNIIILLLCIVYFSSIINFIVLSYNINSYHVKTTAIAGLFRKLYIKTILLFILYLTLLYSILDSFAVLYTYLGNIFNEGIQNSEEIASHLDALYFSITTFFTIGFGDITPSEYSEITKRLVIIQGILSHMVTTVLWPVSLLFVFGKYTKEK